MTHARGQYANETGRMNAVTARTKAENPQAGQPELGDVVKIKSDYDKQARQFEQANNSYQTMTKLASDGTGASDVALGFAFFKAIDPSSTVREGEFAMAGQAMGLPDQLVAMLSRADSGQRFTPELRQQLIRAAGHAVEQQYTGLQSLQQRTEALAGDYGIPPDRVAYDPTGGQGITVPSAARPAPAGEVPPAPAGFVLD